MSDLDRIYQTQKIIDFNKSTATGNTAELIAAQGAGKYIKVMSFTIVCTAASTVQFKSASDAITQAMSFAANGGESKQYSPLGHMRTAANEALNWTIGGTGPALIYGTAVVVTNPSQGTI